MTTRGVWDYASRTVAVLSVIGCLTLVIGCPVAPPTPECLVDTDCAEGEVCTDGVCVEETTPECTEDADCAEGEVCTDGVCVEGETPLDGATLYADNCAACHGADGATGFANDITGMSAADLTTGLESATHGGIDLTADEVSAIATFLGG